MAARSHADDFNGLFRFSVSNMTNEAATSMREITFDELRRELPIPEWSTWARGRLAELGATDEGKQYMRFTKDAVKRFREEVMPTLRFAERQFAGRSDLLVKFPADNGPADALIRSPTSSEYVPIQVTCDWTYEDERSLGIMHQQGWSPTRVFSIEEVSDLIAGRIAAKAAHSAKDTWLLVHINDERWPPEELQGVIAQAKVAAAGSFAATFLVGSSDEKRICELLDGAAVLP